jgi:peptidoglycan/xylan/chitin deacetylase (PgdA/CDA1 family)
VLKRKGIPAGVFVVTELIDKPCWQVHDKLYHLLSKAFDTWPDPVRELRGLFRALRLPANCLMHQRGGLNPMLTVSSILPDLPLCDVRLLMDGLEGSVGNGFHDIPPTLRWSDIADMCKGGITIGSHTKNHVSLPMESPERIADELAGSRQLLEGRLGEPIRHFAYPGGQFTPSVIEAVERAGYEFAYTACGHGDPHHRALTIERLLLWQGSSVDADGRFSPAILNCQAQDLWPPSRRCGRIHESRVSTHG